MQSDGSVENRVEVIDSVDGSNENLKYSIDCSDPEQKGNSENSCEENEGTSSEVEFVDKEDASVAVISIVITRGDAYNQVSAVSEFEGGNDKTDATPSMKFGLPRTESYHEQCRVCQQQSEEPLMVLGCRCRGELAKAHRSCIDIWFRTRGSNKCEICQQVAANVPSPESQPSTSYWLWRVNPDFGGSSIAHGERERRCFSPLWVAFSILIGGLLLDVLISISLGVSALPVNVIIGVIVVLGLGTALRLALECCHEWCLRRVVQRVDTDINPGYHPAV
ncbi:uncharacterized protein LOC143885328 isoform X1 [Tasmannia lanceolata]|uniref:uncharacterized protein LOC143885328 isoform X1 n=1 Tax=Tasmannia lanceolata TaxID=3420 RepID=UPI0040644C8B